MFPSPQRLINVRNVPSGLADPAIRSTQLEFAPCRAAWRVHDHTAAQDGTKTRKLLRKRIAALGEGAGESLDDVRDKGSKARKRVKQRLAKLREEAGDEWDDVGDRWESAKTRLRGIDLGESDDSSSFGPVIAILAG